MESKVKQNTTIVVPVYGDWPSLQVCIESLAENVEAPNKVFLVNDCGPEVEEIEANIKKAIKGNPLFTYYRNETNLGFVGTCNRAVTLDESNNDILLLNSDTKVTSGFLEEMRGVLYANDKHGAVCPRSNNATIMSVPFLFKNGEIDAERTPEYTNQVYSAIAPMLPRYSVVPVAHGFCIMIKRFLINNFGLFDPIYGLGYNEENDFCMRINEYGYSCVVANKTLVYHLESKSFTSEKKRILQEKNHKILTSRYPHYESVVGDYLKYQMDPIDRFADVLATGENEPKKVLVNFYHLPLAMNGTARNCLGFVDLLSRHELVKSGKIIPTIVTSKNAADFHNLHTFGFKVVEPHKIDELFHLTICPLQIFHSDNLQLMNRCSLRIVFAHLDIIAIRTNHLLQKSIINRTVFEDAFRIADRVIAISTFSKQDAISYYPQIADIIEEKTEVLLQGYPDVDFAISEEHIDTTKDRLIKNFTDSGAYALVVGNDFKHKVVPETLKLFVGSGVRILALGSGMTTSDEDIMTIESGGLSDEMIRHIYEQAQFVIFPSLYEGFGLPIAEAARFGKDIIVSDNKLNREVAQLYKQFSNVYFCTSLADVKQQAFNLWTKGKSHREARVEEEGHSFRTLTDYNDELLEAALNTLNNKVEAQTLRDRWSYMARIDQYMISTGRTGYARKSLIERSAHYLKARNLKTYMFMRTVYRRTLKKK